MPQSLSHIVLHLVFSTKNRMSLIDTHVDTHLHAYMSTVCRDQGCHAYRVGGTNDHVHIATTLERTITVSKLVENVKKVSSAWMKTQGDPYRDFYWQKGYGAFSVSPKDLDRLIGYIDGQREHHKVVTFQDELRTFLNRYHIEFDERYVWD